MTAVPKVKIKTDEQVRTKKRKRPETERAKNKKEKLKELKDGLSEIKNKDKASEGNWSAINIEEEKSLMSMGLASLEILDEEDFMIERPGKRKKKTGPKTGSKKSKKSADDEADGETAEGSEEQTVCTKRKKLSFAEKKEQVKLKRKEKMQQVKLRKLENPDSEENKLRLEKIKAKRRAKKLKKMQEKQLKSEVDQFIAEKETETSPSSIEKPVNADTSVLLAPSGTSTEELSAPNQSTTQSNESPDEDHVSVPSTSPETKETETKETETKETTGVDSVATVEVESISAAADTEPLSVTNPAVDVITTMEVDTIPDETADVDTVPDETADGDVDIILDDTEPESGTVALTEEEKEKAKAWLNLDVCEPIVKGLLDLGFLNPTPIQQACIPAGLLKYKDVIGAAETGSGKTLAFGIPLVQRIMRLSDDKCVKGLVLCPTRELALQVTDHLRAACKHTGVRIVPIVGGIAAPKQERLLSYKPPILVATPGRLWQLIQEHPYLQDLSTVKFLVIDEADRMVADGHFEEVTQIIGRIPGPEQRNAFLFSATLAFTIDRLDEKAKKKKKTKQEKRSEKKGNAGIELLVRNIGVKEKVEKVDFTQKRGTAETLTETYFLCNVEDKDLHLYYMLLNHPGKILVFANSIDNVMNIVHIMKLLELPVIPLHSALQQRQRFKYLEKFTQSTASVMICTDIAARGLDIPEVDTVIHYQLPSTKEAYIHRSGRTARADNPGLSVAIVGPKDFKTYKKITSQMSEFPTEGNRVRLLRPAVEQARQIFKIERLRTRPDKREAKLVALAKEAGFADTTNEDEPAQALESKKEVKIMKAKLRVLLQQPVIDPLNSSRYATKKGAMDNFQTLNSFSLGVSALEHSKSKKKR